jgi:TadE-like protein
MRLIRRPSRRIAPSPKRSRRSQLGQGLTELALVTPVLLFLFAGAADLGRAFYAYVAIENAAKEGAFFGATRPICDVQKLPLCVDPGNVTWRVQNESDLENPDGTPLAPTITCEDRGSATVYSGATIGLCDEGDTYVVEVEYEFQLLTPIMGQIVGDAISLRSEARAVVLNSSANPIPVDPTPGISVQKLIKPDGAQNENEIKTKCLEPDDSDANGYYRSPCRDSTSPGALLYLKFRTGDALQYKITIGNSGSTNLSQVDIEDTFAWPPNSAQCPNRPNSLSVGQVYTCSYTRTAPVPTGGAVTFDYVNQVTAEAQDVSPEVDQVTIKVELPPPDLRVLKFVSTYPLGDDGDGVPGFGTADTLSVFFNTQVPQATVWYKVFVENRGGQPATGLQITDSFGLPFGTANCPNPPASLAVNASYTCIYSRSFTTAGPRSNLASATATNVTPDFNDAHTAVVTVQQCTGATNRVVPSLIGLNKANSLAQWTAAGFTAANLTQWNGQPNATVVTQSRQAFSCLGQASTMTVTRQATP